MKNSARLLAALVGLAVVSTTAHAQNWRGNRGNACPTPVYRDRGSNVGFAISIGNTRGFNRGFHRGFNNGFSNHGFYNRGFRGGHYWGANRGFSRAGHDFWIRNNPRVITQPVCATPFVQRQTVVYTTPVVRQQPVVVERPVVVEQPVVIERPVYQQPTYTTPAVRETIRETVREVPVYRDIVPQDPASRYTPGWNAIALGDSAYAREFFGDQAILRPSDPTPKAGLAIARAAGGLDDQAEWAMRRAVRADIARARTDLPLYDIEAQLTRIEARYLERSETYNDRWFMLAATRYLMGDLAGAKEAANQALSFNERDAEARRIFDLVTHSG